MESYNSGVGREGLIWVWIVSGVGNLYPKGYTNVKEIIMRFEKGWKGNYFVSLLFQTKLVRAHNKWGRFLDGRRSLKI